MKWTMAVIPTKIKPPSLTKLVDTLLNSITDGILILNNGEEWFMEYGGEYQIIVNEQQSKSIYEMWNFGLGFPVIDGKARNILVLNDDVEFQPNLVKVLAEKLRSDPNIAIVYPDVNAQKDTGQYSLEYTETTAGAGGMTGYCFMIKGELGFRVDENLKLYWGDDDLVKQVLARGYKIAKVVDLPINHAGSYTINRMDQIERYNLMEADRRYFNKKYGEDRSPV